MSLDEKNNKDTENSRVSYSEYQDLTPIDHIENGGEYIAALNWAFQNKKIKNIALTGPYGAGKSSIIETFLAEDEKRVSEKGRAARNKAIRKTALNISMATFVRGHPEKTDGGGNKIDIGAEEVEEGILKQLFYKVEPSKIPQSRYRKLHTMSFRTVVCHIVAGLLLIGLLLAIFASSTYEKIIGAVKAFLPACLSGGFFTAVATLALLALVSTVGAYLYLAVISKFRVKEIKLPTDTTVQSGDENEDSVFNRNLDEIVYFFEATGYRTVFFEDLDRLTDPKIFVHLRELNNLLNNDDAIKNKPVVFVYAVRDDIFSREDRTKFFDFIIPVIPVMNSTNSGDILLQRLEESKKNGVAHDISQGFVLDVAPYISDMRVLQNIYNEFVVYKNTLRTSQGLSLSDEQMLAMIVFKNLYPNDFADIQDEKGIIKEAFQDKSAFIEKKRNVIQEKIDHYEDTIAGAQGDVAKSIKELKYAMIGTFMGGFYQFNGFRGNWSVSPEEVIQDDFDMTELTRKNCKYVNALIYSRGSRDISINLDLLDSYVERWKHIKELGEKGLSQLQENLQKLRDEQHSLIGMPLTQLLKLFPVEEVLSDEVRGNRLLTFLLRRGYIDEKYANYINYFKGTSITKDDMNFILSVKNQTPLSFDYQLTKTSMVVDKLQNYEFEQKAIYNFALLEELLAHGPEEKLIVFIAQLADENEVSWRFIDEFVGKTKQKEHFIRLLAEKWTGMWAYISANETLTYERQLLYLRIILKVSTPATLEDLNKDGCLAHYFERNDDILQKLLSCDVSNVEQAIDHLNIHFENIQVDGVSKELLEFIFDGRHYKLNASMIQTIVNYKNASMTKMLEEKPYTTVLDLEYDALTEYIHDHFVDYIREIVLVHTTLSDHAEDVVDMLIRLKDEKDLQLQLVDSETFHLDRIEECAGDRIQAEKDTWRPIWDALLAKNVVAINWENVISYWKVYKLSDELKKYISAHAGELRGMDAAEVPDDFIRQFIQVDVEPVTKQILIPVLRMKSFDLAISSIDKITLDIMIGCKYFEFTVSNYSAVKDVSPDLGLQFVLNNQDEYMDLKTSISMTTGLFEGLICSRNFRPEYRVQLFLKYGKHYMTEKVALHMNELQLPVTKEIFNVAWSQVSQEMHTELLLENCTIFNADELEQRFREIGGEYLELADRTRRHDVILSDTPQNKKLAEHLKTVGYITSREEKSKRLVDSDPGGEKGQKILKIRVKQVK